ncbi:MAG: hypothetical protein QNK37_23795 [Acidobacteriota bacterium]|nr:hypothetical protein [Acidobacteriota bacterium]
MACSDEIVETKPGDPVELEKGSQVKLNDAVITFIGVSEDSRCPEGARCMWAGQARVDLEIAEDGKTTPLQLVVPGNQEKVNVEGESGDMTVACLNLVPYPKVDQAIDAATYRVTLVFK